MAKSFLVFGAHPDDPDGMFGGAAIKLIAAGHHVTFVSVTNGDAGHHIMSREMLEERRYKETQECVKVAGLDSYIVMNNHDGLLENTLKNRIDITRIIRQVKPDVVITHRLCDYHPDHRITAQLVLDTSYMLRVPLFCPDTPVPPKNPVFAYSYDSFTDPRPFRIDAFVDISDVLDKKFQMIDCHKSQFYEWLPWLEFGKDFKDAEHWDWERRRDWLMTCWSDDYRKQAELLPGKTGGYAETFEYSPYGAPATKEEFQALFE